MMHFQSAGDNPLEEYFISLLRRRLEIEEDMAWAFILRTGLPIDECTFVLFRGKTFVQWKGAVQMLHHRGAG